MQHTEKTEDVDDFSFGRQMCPKIKLSEIFESHFFINKHGDLYYIMHKDLFVSFMDKKADKTVLSAVLGKKCQTAPKTTPAINTTVNNTPYGW